MYDSRARRTRRVVEDGAHGRVPGICWRRREGWGARTAHALAARRATNRTRCSGTPTPSRPSWQPSSSAPAGRGAPRRPWACASPRCPWRSTLGESRAHEGHDTPGVEALPPPFLPTIEIDYAPSLGRCRVCKAGLVARHDDRRGVHHVDGRVVGQLRAREMRGGSEQRHCTHLDCAQRTWLLRSVPRVAALCRRAEERRVV